MDKLKLVFMGTPDFALPSLKHLLGSGHELAGVVTRADRPRGRGKQLAMPPVKEWAVEQGIEVLQPETVKDQGFHGRLKEINPHLIITAAYGKFLPPAILNQPPLGCINLHASLLPAYRGAAPIHRAVMEGIEKSGVSIIYMVREMDAGDIIMQEEVPVTLTDTAGSLHDRLAEKGASLLVASIEAIARGDVEPKPQDPAAVTFAPPLRPEEEKLDWGRKAHVLYNQIRGMNPWPGSYTHWQGKRLKVWQAAYPDINLSAPFSAKPGTVLDTDGHGIVVATGEGVLKILTVQPAGKRSMTAASFLRGYSNTQNDGVWVLQ